MAKEKIIVDYRDKNSTIQCSPHILKLVREKFSVQNPVYMKRRFDPRKYAITPSGAFQIGLWEEIEGYLTSLAIPIEIILTPDFRKQYTPSIYSGELETVEGFTYYDYQEETIRLFLKQGRGIGLIATAGGKTLIIGGLCKNLIKQ